MIGRIRGILAEKKPPHLLIEVGGISYELQAPMMTFYQLPDLGQAVDLYTHLVVREDAHLLYGFFQPQERTLFRSLIKISNIGPKSALAILSGIEPDSFVQCVLDNDTLSLTRIPGIGAKTAERLIIEMRDKLNDWHWGDASGQNTVTDKSNVTNHAAVQEAINALVALGYKPQEATRAVKKLATDDMTSQEIIRQALKNI